jgi:rhamnosyltransferase
MTPQSVCAVIVTYHPNADIEDHIRNVAAQVNGLVVVDNGSNEDARRALRGASRANGFHLLENEKNLGIASALNQGIQAAKAEGYGWVVLFDQDSKITDGFVRQMFADWETHSQRERVASVYPRYLDPVSGTEVMVPRTSDGSPILPMTSGTLMPLWIFERIGWFESEYFIDLVDWEYCFRIRAAGFLVTGSEARLLHAAGFPAKTTILGRSLHSSHHSADRRYYIARNCVVFYRKYFSIFPGWILKCIYSELRDVVVCSLVERQRWRKFRNFLLGTWDGINGKMGERQRL